MRRAVILGAALLAWPGRADAQQCHSLNRSSWRSQGLLTGVRLDAAAYRNARYEGDWQGLAPTLAYSHPRVTAMAMLPAYRLNRNGRPGYGIGDLTLASPALRRALRRTVSRPRALTSSISAPVRSGEAGITCKVGSSVGWTTSPSAADPSISS